MHAQFSSISRRQAIHRVGALGAGVVAASSPSWAQASTIKLGRTSAITGNFSYPYVEMGKGIKAAIQEVNAAGGVDKRKLEIISLDDQGNPATATENTKILIEKEQVFAFLGCGPTQTVMAMLPLINAAKIPLVAPGTGVDALRAQYNPLTIYTRPTYGTEVAKLAQQIVTVGQKKCAVWVTDNPLGKSVLASFEAASKKVGNSDWKVFMVTDNVDAQKLSDEVAAWGPQSIMSGAASPTSMGVCKTLRTKVKVPCYTFSLLGVKPLLDAIGEGAQNTIVSQVVPNPENSTIAIVKSFQAAMKKAGETDFTYSALEGYIATRVLIEGLRRSKSDADRERFTRSFLTMRPYNLGGFEMNFSPTDNTGSNYVELTHYIGGKFRR